MKGKKGVSPLIATVLLIGFSVALAAVVMTWGLDYLKSTTAKVGEKTDEVLKCATDLEFRIASADCAAGTVLVENNGVIDITSITFRVYTGADVIPVVEEGIPSLGVKQYTVDLTGATKVEAIASVAGSSGPMLCKDIIEEYIISC